jgi:voltage-gated sodium channel
MHRYLEDPWNKLDAFIVLVGFVEMTPGRVVFEAFPVVILRLLRLLRVFRLAKALPRLRSIVEALISGFSAVGWVCVLVIVFNYIVGCMCMLVLQGNDPFHFGTVGRSVFTVLRLETGDSWDQIL